MVDIYAMFTPYLFRNKVSIVRIFWRFGKWLMNPATCPFALTRPWKKWRKQVVPHSLSCRRLVCISILFPLAIRSWCRDSPHWTHFVAQWNSLDHLDALSVFFQTVRPRPKIILECRSSDDAQAWFSGPLHRNSRRSISRSNLYSTKSADVSFLPRTPREVSVADEREEKRFEQ